MTNVVHFLVGDSPRDLITQYFASSWWHLPSLFSTLPSYRAFKVCPP